MNMRMLLCAGVLLSVYPFLPQVMQGTTVHKKKVAATPQRYRHVLVVQEGLDRVVLFNKDKPQDRALINVGEKPHEIAISTDGRTAYVSNFGLLEANHKVGTAGTTVSVIDIDSRRETARLALPSGATAPHGLKLRPGASAELFTNAEEGREEMIVFDTATGHIQRTFPLAPGIHNFVFDNDGKYLYAFSTTDSVYKIDPDNGKILATTTVPHVRGLAWNTDGRELLVGGRGQVLVLDPRDLSVISIWKDLPVGQIFYPSATPDGREVFLPAVLDGIVLIVDSRTGAIKRRITTGSPLQVVFDEDEALISNVKVPATMLPKGEDERPGGLTRLSLRDLSMTSVEATEDANGIALAP